MQTPRPPPGWRCSRGCTGGGSGGIRGEEGAKRGRIVEGSGALAVGGLLKHAERFKGKKAVAVVCGRNIDLEVFKQIIG